MQWVKIDEATFYAAVWVVGFLTSMCVFLGSASRKPISQCLALSGIAGFLAFFVVSVFVTRFPWAPVGDPSYLGVAAFIGWTAEFAEKYRERLFRYLLGKYLPGINEGTDDSKKDQ